MGGNLGQGSLLSDLPGRRALGEDTWNTATLAQHWGHSPIQMSLLADRENHGGSLQRPQFFDF